MSDVIRQLITEHHAYYEVLPYYVVIEERHGSPTANTHRVQAGFDIDIYGTRMENELPLHSHKYALGYAELQKIAEETSDHPSTSCSIEVIPFFSISFSTPEITFSRKPCYESGSPIVGILMNLPVRPRSTR